MFNTSQNHKNTQYFIISKSYNQTMYTELIYLIHSFFARTSKNWLSLKCSQVFEMTAFCDVLRLLSKMSLNGLCSYFFLEKMTKVIMYSLTLSQNYPERHNNGTFLYILVKITMYFYLFDQKNTLKVTKKQHFLFKKGI